MGTMEFDAILRQFNREGGGVGALALAAHDGFVGNKPVVAATTFVFAVGVSPAGDVAFVGIGHSHG